MKHRIFNKPVPADAIALVEAASRPARLEFKLRGEVAETQETSETAVVDRSLKTHARGVVSATEKTGYAMPLSTFLSLWEKA
jgi:hypothetical protein